MGELTALNVQCKTHNGLIELGLNLSQQPVKGLGGQAELFCHSLGAEGGAQVDVEEQCGVLLSLFAQRVVPIHDDQFLTELMSTWKTKRTLKFNGYS